MLISNWYDKHGKNSIILKPLAFSVRGFFILVFFKKIYKNLQVNSKVYIFTPSNNNNNMNTQFNERIKKEINTLKSWGVDAADLQVDHSRTQFGCSSYIICIIKGFKIRISDHGCGYGGGNIARGGNEYSGCTEQLRAAKFPEHFDLIEKSRVTKTVTETSRSLPQNGFDTIKVIDTKKVHGTTYYTYELGFEVVNYDKVLKPEFA